MKIESMTLLLLFMHVFDCFLYGNLGFIESLQVMEGWSLLWMILEGSQVN
jgi:hypothetical protein